MPEKYGIESTKTVAGLIFKSIQEYEKMNEDGKITWLELATHIPRIAIKIPGSIKAIPDIPKEFSDLDSQEQNELLNYFVDEFDLENDKAEQIVEHIVELMVHNFQEIKTIIELSKS